MTRPTNWMDASSGFVNIINRTAKARMEVPIPSKRDHCHRFSSIDAKKMMNANARKYRCDQLYVIAPSVCPSRQANWFWHSANTNCNPSNGRGSSSASQTILARARCCRDRSGVNPWRGDRGGRRKPDSYPDEDHPSSMRFNRFASAFYGFATSRRAPSS